MAANRLSAGDKAPDLTLTAGDLSKVMLSSLWRGQPLLLTFLRHFG
jgi:peroxiredoxin